MIVLKTTQEIAKMQDAGKIAAGALKAGGEAIEPGMTTKQLDKIIHKYILSHGAKPSFLGYGGFPGSACISINDEVIHGIPSHDRKICEGDIVSLDVGAFYNGYHGDNAATFAVGNISDEAKKLLDVTRQSLYEAIQAAKPGARLGDVSHAVQAYVEQYGFGIVKKFVGHGVGTKLHEPPDVPNFGTAGKGVRLTAGMTIAIEPMINLVGDDVTTLSDGWTVKTKSGSLSAHFEHTIAITSDGAKILTLA
jgi:methionyl aminopeptidase